MQKNTLKAMLLTGAFSVITCYFLFVAVQQSYSVPSYARQTSLACNACHTVFPELTSFGRLFKLNAYTLTGIKAIESQGAKAKPKLKLLSISPLSAMVQTSFTRLDERSPGTQNNDFGFPQQLSFFFAGEITPRMGTFIQVTYDDQGAEFGWDNTDIRYANHANVMSRDLIYGITLNNSPTVQDVWNSTPAWGFPFASSAVAPTPTAATLVEGALAQAVLGLGAYGFYNSLVYGEFSIYRSAQQGGPQPPNALSTMTIKGVSPYWRLAVQRDWTKHYLEVGTYGLTSALYPSGVTGLTDKYTDLAVDMQYQYSMTNSNLTAHATWIHENQDLDATFAAGAATEESNDLNSFRVDGSVYFNQRYAFFLGYFYLNGNRDVGLFAPASIEGSRTGKPNSSGLIIQASYLPWFNTRFSLQYVLYSKFNGADDNYDGFGRDASNNNALYMLAWINF